MGLRQSAEINHTDQGRVVGRQGAQGVDDGADLRMIIDDLLQDGLQNNLYRQGAAFDGRLANILILAAFETGGRTESSIV